jgi:asparagine synthetase B (glutamine-hydrolysing)
VAVLRFLTWEPLVRFRQPQAYVAHFSALFDAAVADRITADRLAVQLSGGMDSTSIAASAHATLKTRGAPPDAMRAVTAILEYWLRLICAAIPAVRAGFAVFRRKT